MLGLLPREGRLINFSRGAVVENKGLLELLDNGHLAHAVLDVFEQEPLPTESSLWSHPKITVLPHISAPTTISSSARVVARNVRLFREEGEVPLSVDPVQGY